MSIIQEKNFVSRRPGKDSRDLAGKQRSRTEIVFERFFRANLDVLEPAEEHGVPGRVRTQPHRAQIGDVQITACRREPIYNPQSHQTQHASHDRHSGSPAGGLEQPFEVADG